MSILSQMRSTNLLRRHKPAKRSVFSGWVDERGVVAIEFALLAVPFFIVLFFIFELSIDLFEQEALDSGLHLAARQVQTGNAQNVTNGAAFVANYLCPDLGSMLTCSNLYVNVTHISPIVGQDYYNFTTGAPPGAGGSLDLSSYGSASFCNAGPSEFLLISAVYISPTVIGSLVPGLLSVKYGGSIVHPTLSQVAGFSEGFPVTPTTKTAAKAC